mgnify:CR=1 FL=1
MRRMSDPPRVILTGQNTDQVANIEAHESVVQIAEGQPARLQKNVDVRRIVRCEQCPDLPFVLVEIGRSDRLPPLIPPRLIDLWREDTGCDIRRQLCNDVLSLLHQLCTAFNKVIRPERRSEEHTTELQSH